MKTIERVNPMSPASPDARPTLHSVTEPTLAWPTITPLSGSERRAPYPVKALPPVVRDIVEGVTGNLATPADLAALTALGCVATAVVGAVEVELGPSWRQPAALYFCGIAAPGESKTGLIQALRRPLNAIEQGRRQAAEPKVHATRVRLAFLKGQRTKATDAGDWSAVQDADREMGDLGSPNMPRLLVQDCTPEALVNIMAENRGRIGYVVDEGGEVFDLMGRYQGNATSNLGIFLAAWDGTEYANDRVGEGYRHIPSASLVMSLMVQPSVARALLRDTVKVGRGLPQRFLFAWPESNVGSRSVDRPPVYPPHTEAWRELLSGLADEAHEVEGEPIVLPLSRGAETVFKEWQRKLEPRLRPGTGDLGADVLAGWGSKIAGQVGRLALVLHVATAGALAGQVSVATMEAAIEIGEYHISHTLHAFGVAGTDDSTQDAESVLCWLKGRGKSEVTTRDVARSKTWRVDRARDALERLSEHGYVRPLATEGAGRTSAIWEINPTSFEREA